MADTTLSLSLALPDGRTVPVSVVKHDDGSFDVAAFHVNAPAPPPPVKPAPITGLKASAMIDSVNGATVTLNWALYPATAQGVTGVKIVRNGAIVQAAYNPNWNAYADFGALKPATAYAYVLTAVKADGTESDPATVSVTTPAVTPPPPPPPPPPARLPAPPNFTAAFFPVDNTIRASCGTVPGATTYRLHDTTDGSDPDTSPTAQHYDTTSVPPMWTIPVTMDVALDVMHRLCPAGVASDGTVGVCSPDAMVTVPHKPASPPPPPPPPMASMAPAPTNLRVKGLGGGSDALTWDAVPGVGRFNVYADDRLLGTVSSPAFTVPPAKFVAGRFYTVTAVDGMGMESLACSPTLAQGGPQGQWNPPEGAPVGTAVGEWNNGAARIVLEWHWTGGKASYWGDQFKIYRDGALYAENIGVFRFVDANVKPGEAHSYQVSVVATNVEGPKSAPVGATAPTQAPVGGGTLALAGTVPNDTSMVVKVTPYPGALDYRAYVQGHPEKCKYAGKGSTSIEWNGVDPASSPLPTLVIEALDKLGPYMRMHGTSDPADPVISRAVRPMAAGMPMHINGHGDPSNVPNVLASATVPVTLKAKTLAGGQVFLDTFRVNKPLAQRATVEPNLFARYGWGKPNTAANPYVKQYNNDRWLVTLTACNAQDTRVFFMSRHLMDVISDGGCPGGGPEGDSSPPHNNNASTSFVPIGADGNPLAFDFSGGKVLHVTMEVDGHFSPRRWCDIGLFAAGDNLIDPAVQKLKNPPEVPVPESITQSGEGFVWEINAGVINLTHLVGNGLNNGTCRFPRENAIDLSYPGDHVTAAARDQGTPPGNGTIGDLDIRPVYDLYTDGRRVVVRERGKTLADKVLATPLAFSKAHVYFSHHAYHLVNESSEVARRGNEPFWNNCTPDTDQRHWTHLGAEVLASWPF